MNSVKAALGVVSTVLGALGVVKIIIIPTLRPFRLWSLYGVPGIFLFLFGSQTTWSVEAQVLGRLDEDDALQFKKSVQDECTMVSVAAAIVAQIAITALSLDGLSQTHWVAKGFLVFSLISALMAVYYASTQQRAMGRLLRSKQIRAWIRGGVGAKRSSLDRDTRRLVKQLAKQFKMDLRPCDLDYLDPNQYLFLQVPNYLRQKSFTPSVVSVITISAPQMLLSGSLITLLLGLGIYFGFVWTDKLDTQAGVHDSRNIFIMFVLSLGVCILVYSLSSPIHDTEERSEAEIVESHMKDYICPRKNELEARWNLFMLNLDNNDPVRFHPGFPAAAPSSTPAPPRTQSLLDINQNKFNANAPPRTMTV